MTQTTVVIVLTLLLGVQPVTTDLYLPALPTLARALDAGPGAAQLTLSALIICFGVAQLVWGPLSDRFGRRPVLLVGLTLYGVAGVGAALAPTIAWLIAWRALQGTGMAAAVTCGRSIVRDLYEPREGARVMSRALGGLGLLAMASPLLGGFLVQALDWRATLAAVALFGAVVLAFIALRLTETLPRPDPRGTELRRIAANWRRILGHPTFVAWAALLCASWGGLFAMLASSSFVFIEVLGASRQAFGAVLASCSVAYIVGTILCRRLLAHGNASRAVAIGASFSLAGGLLLAGLSLAGRASIIAMLPGLWLYGIGHGINQPCGQAGVTSPFPDSAGTAASLSGFAMMAVAFGVGLALAAVTNGTVFPLTLTVGAFGITVAAVAWTLVRRHGDRRVQQAPGGPTSMTTTTLCIAGPTASGKTAAALAVADALAASSRPVEIVSVDSALVYRGMNIGTAKPSAAERARVPHHLIDIVNPSESYSAARFAADAQRLIAEITARGRLPLLVGGTMLYFKALFEGLDAMPAADRGVRAELTAQAAAQGPYALYEELQRVNPVTAARLPPGDSQRIQRALEVYRVSGRPMSQHHGQARAPATPYAPLIALEPADRGWLHARIAQRFRLMLAAGLVDEVRGLRTRGDLTPDLPAMRCVGYRQTWEALEHGRLDMLAERGIAATRQLAKRQLTWLRGMPARQVVGCDAADAALQVVLRVQELLRTARDAPDLSSYR